MDTRKELKNAYKNRLAVGGVFCIRCSGSGRVWIKSTKDMQGQINKFRFAVANNACPEPGMRDDWIRYGIDSFSFHIMEELEKKETQTDAEFAADIATLHELWIEKQQSGNREE